MKINKMLPRAAAALLAVLLLLSFCPAAFAAQGQLSIGSPEELMDFARRCASDEYSRELEVKLTADIDISGKAVSIPLFLGTFDGQGHKISGLSLTDSASAIGLFSRVEKGAVIKNLHVEGEVTPAGTQSRVGGIAGENFGSIEGCSFSGVVIGVDCVGGIAGQNGSSGVITDCTAAGVVRGSKYTGGITGQNAGSVLRCNNASSVNTTISEEDVNAAELENLENTLYSILKREETAESAVTTDTGGIAGYSTGVLQSCGNTGTIGYPHVGYNVGGIAGRQNGYMTGCVNRGSVQGRKDVGGIVGQMAPDISLQVSSDGLDEMEGELSALQRIINGALGDAQYASDTISGHMSRINDYAGSARESAGSISGQLSDFVDDNITAVNDAVSLAQRYTAGFVPVLDDLASASNGAAQTMDDLRDLVDTMDSSWEYGSSAFSSLQSFCREIQLACDALGSAADALGEIFFGRNDSAAVRLRDDLDSLKQASVELETVIGEAIEEYELYGYVSPETAQELKDGMRTVVDCCGDVLRDIVQLFAKIDWGNIDGLEEAADCLRRAVKYFNSAVSHFKKAMSSLRDALKALAGGAGLGGELFEALDDVFRSSERTFSSLSDAFSKMSNWAEALSSEELSQLTALGPEFSQESDSLNESLSGIGSELAAINAELTSSDVALISDIRAVNDQFVKVMNLFLNMLNNTRNVDYTDVYEDVSEESLQSAVRGKALECINYGSVDADRNAGGIAGAMAIEYDLDPEDDLLSSENHSLHFTYQTKAILLDCSNYGSIKAKKSCAGGVAGRMDLGTISGCGSWGDTASESGDYVGGIAGLSLSSVRSSYAKCTLSGGKYVGGITGSGSRVSDCLSMVEIAECTQLGGAVAGEITGDYTGNFFVSDSLAGVDRISYSGKAEQLSYEELCEKENAPENFRQLRLSFYADGELLREQSIRYGDSVSDDAYPQAPEKEGYYVRWDKTGLSSLHFDTVVTAVYEPYITTLASEEEREGRPVFLAEGFFREGDSILVSPVTAEPPDSGKLVEAWSVELPDDGQEQHVLRWLIPEDCGEKLTVYARGGDGWKRLESETVGSCLRFEISEDGQLAIVSRERVIQWPWMLAAAAACAALVTGVALRIRHRRRRHKGKRQYTGKHQK